MIQIKKPNAVSGQPAIVLYEIEAYEGTEFNMDIGIVPITLGVADTNKIAFASDWYVIYEGIKHTLKTLEPTAEKSSGSWNYTYQLLFKSWLDDLNGEYMNNFVAGSGVPVTNDFAAYFNLTQLVALVNKNLDYSFKGKGYLLELNPTYVDQNPILVQFSRVKIWNSVQQIFPLYGESWVADGNIIKIGYPPEAISHVFGYGFQGCLEKIERVTDDSVISTIIEGEGGERNLPQRYFKAASEGWIGDPDANAQTALIPFNRLQPFSYRCYIHGWNGSTPYPNMTVNETNEYNRGIADAAISTPSNIVFNPKREVSSPTGIAKYGVKRNAVEPNDNIYPTLQGATDAVLGRLDEAIAVEAVLNDNLPAQEGTDSNGGIQTAPPATVTNFSEMITPYGGTVQYGQWSDEFSVPANFNTNGAMISYQLDIDVVGKSEGWGTIKYGDALWVNPPTLSTAIELYKVINPSQSSLVWQYSASGASTSWHIPRGIVEAGATYKWHIQGWYDNNLSVTYPSFGGTITINYETLTKFGIAQNIPHGATVNDPSPDPYKQTFDVWIKNIWGSTQGASETDAAYALRVWKDLAVEEDTTLLFSDGLLAGSEYEFILLRDDNIYQIFPDRTKTLNGTTSEWRLRLKKTDAEVESSGKQLPNINQNAVAGNHFFFINITMPFEPYVFSWERQQEAYLANILAKTDKENPAFSVNLDKVAMASFPEVAKVTGGTMMSIKNKALTDDIQLDLYIQSITKKYTKDKILPDWDIQVNSNIVVEADPITLINGEIAAIQNLANTQSLNTKNLTRLLEGTFLKSNGVDQTSYSNTWFTKLVQLARGWRTPNFISGLLGGRGAALTVRDDGKTELEVDILKVREELHASTFIINQYEARGGIQIYSAATMVVSSVEDAGTAHRVYFDTHSGTVLQTFVVNDQARCLRFDPTNAAVLRAYWCLVTATGLNYIELSKTDRSGSAIPIVADVIAQMGHRTDTARQSAYIVDQMSGGSTVQYAAIGQGTTSAERFSLVGKNYVGAGVNPATGRAYQYVYGDLFIGDRTLADNFLTYQIPTGETEPVLHLQGKMTIGTGSSGFNNLSESTGIHTEIDANTAGVGANATAIANANIAFANEILRVNAEFANQQAQLDGAVVAYFLTTDPTLQNYPANTWITAAEKEAAIGNTYTNTVNGYSWRWLNIGGYSWDQMADSAATEALAKAGEAQQTADGKMTSFQFPASGNQTPSTYQHGDLWTLTNDTQHTPEKTGTALMCRIAPTGGNNNYVKADWVEEWKYAEGIATATANALLAQQAADAANTLANTANVAAGTANTAIGAMNNDGVFDLVEKQNIRTAWEEYSNIANTTSTAAQAGVNGVYKKTLALATTAGIPTTTTTAMTNAYNNLKTMLNALSLYGTTNTDFSGGNTRVAMAARFATMRTSVDAVINAITTKAQELAESVQTQATAQLAMIQVNTENINNMETQLDGGISNYFLDGQPSASTYPEASWTDVATRDLNVGDTYTNIEFFNVVTPPPFAGYTWKYTKAGTGATATYSWVRITNATQVANYKAMAKSKHVKDGVNRTYGNGVLPTVYGVGDSWILNSDTQHAPNTKGTILYAIVARETYLSSDWVDESKYVGAEELQSTLRNLILNSDNSGAGWTSEDYLIAYPFLGTYKPTSGEVATLVINAELAAGATGIRIRDSQGATTITEIPKSAFIGNTVTWTFHWVASGSNTQMAVYILPYGGGAPSTIHWMTMVAGNKSSLLWSAAPEDIQTEITTAAQKGIDAQADFDTMNNDANFSIIEKKEMRTGWETYSGGIQNTTHTAGNAGASGVYKQALARATTTGLTALRTALTNAYNAYKTILNNLALYTNVSTPFAGANTKLALGQKLTTLIDAVANVDAGVTAIAQALANVADGKSDDALGKLTDIASDGKLTPDEKITLNREWLEIVAEKPKNNASAVEYGVSTTAYDAAYSTLNTYVTPLLASLTTTSTIVRTTFNTNFNNYFAKRQDLLDDILTAAKLLADNAQGTADKKSETFTFTPSASTAKPSNYKKDDQWILQNNTIHPAGKIGTMLFATVGSQAYWAGDWVDKLSYDNTVDVVEAGLSVRGSMVIQDSNGLEVIGLDGSGTAGSDVAFFVGATLANKNNAKTKILHDGTIDTEGVINSKLGSVFGLTSINASGYLYSDINGSDFTLGATGLFFTSGFGSSLTGIGMDQSGISGMVYNAQNIMITSGEIEAYATLVEVGTVNAITLTMPTQGLVKGRTIRIFRGNDGTGAITVVGGGAGFFYRVNTAGSLAQFTMSTPRCYAEFVWMGASWLVAQA